MSNTYEFVFTIEADTLEEAEEELQSGFYHFGDWTEVREISSEVTEENKEV